MLAKKSRKIKTIEADNAFDFDSRVNGFTDQLDLQGTDYTVELHVTPKLLAIITYTKTVWVAEGIAEEYELMGETHYCIECPLYVRPTDGRVRHTKCKKALDEKGNPNGPWCTKDKKCCDRYYEMMKKGEQ